MISYVLKPKPPFRLDLTVWALRRRPENQIDRWEDGVYRRVLPVEDSSTQIEIRQLSSSDAPRLSIQIHSDRESQVFRRIVTLAVERLLGIRLDLQDFYKFAARKPKLDSLALHFRGMKPPRFLTGFECLANAIACQQISLAAGIQILNRFSMAFGLPFNSVGGRQFAFPRPQDLIGAVPVELVQLGFSRQKAIALLELAQSIQSGAFDLESLYSVSDDVCIDQLCHLRGIGRWSAEYAMLRGLGRLNIFPGDDVGAVNNLKLWLGLSEELNFDRVQHILKRWKPFAGLLYLHLLLDNLASRGHVQPTRMNLHIP